MSGKWWVWSKERQGKESIEWLLLLCAGGGGRPKVCRSSLATKLSDSERGRKRKSSDFFLGQTFVLKRKVRKKKKNPPNLTGYLAPFFFSSPQGT